MHSETIHDYPIYSYSYKNSYNTLQNLLNEKPETDIIIDLHRDLYMDSEGNTIYYAPTTSINNEAVTQLMLVIGKSELDDTNWIKNLQFAIEVQKKANEMYPNLFLPIIFRNAEYNQQLRPASVILEVGGTHNTFDQAILSMKYFSEILNEVLK